ncbi:MAG TPA: hypothetical protein VEH76_13980 [Methylocystis sp.]|nr:hypothetical protein [Methylocystis sp.]
MVSMRLNLADPDQEPSDEQLEVIAKEFLKDVLEKKALVRQRMAAAKEEARADMLRRMEFELAEATRDHFPPEWATLRNALLRLEEQASEEPPSQRAIVSAARTS